MIRSVSGHGHVFHSAVGGGRRGQNAAVIGLFRGGGPGLAGTGGGRIAGRRIVVGLTIAVDRSSGDGILILLALGADYQFLRATMGYFAPEAVSAASAIRASVVPSTNASARLPATPMEVAPAPEMAWVVKVWVGYRR